MGFVFQHEIVAGTVLVVEQVESQNYVATISGWVIRADGTAEFLSVTIRGTFISGTGTGQHVAINDSNAPNGIAFYTGDADESFPGVVQPQADANSLSVSLISPLSTSGGSSGSALVVASGKSGTNDYITLSTLDLILTGNGIVDLEGPGPTRLLMTTDGSGDYLDIQGNRVYIREAPSGSGAGAVMQGGDFLRIGETWHVVGAAGEPTFAGNWAVSGAKPVGFFKDPTGRVQLRGRGAEPVAASVIMFTLPIGYRPTQDMSFPVKTNNDGGTVSWLTITTAGAVTFSGNLAQARVQTILDSVSFPTF